MDNKNFLWLQLLTTVINGITNFWSSFFILPKACTDEINSLCGNFVWRETILEVVYAKVSWESVCKSKEERGLGLRNLTVWNVACAIKLIWLLFFQHVFIWARWYTVEVLEGNIRVMRIYDRKNIIFTLIIT